MCGLRLGRREMVTESLAGSLVVKEPAAWLRLQQPASIRYARDCYNGGGNHRRGILDIEPIHVGKRNPSHDYPAGGVGCRVRLQPEGG
jgi:hypothetical protein